MKSKQRQIKAKLDRNKAESNQSEMKAKSKQINITKENHYEHQIKAVKQNKRKAKSTQSEV